jgi:flagellar protein FlgJ
MKPVVTGDLAAPLALDASALSALKHQAKDSPKAALSAAAGQFEALFVQMLLKSMRDALPQDGMLQSDTSKMYTSMFDQQIAQQMSKRGIGLRQMLEKQLAPAVCGTRRSRRRPAAPTRGTRHARTTTAAVHGARSTATAAPERRRRPGAACPRTCALSSRRCARTPRPRPRRSACPPISCSRRRASRRAGARSQPKAADGSASHNLFGIKAGRSWNGAVAVASTTEYVAGALVRTVDKFRSYGSYTEASRTSAAAHEQRPLCDRGRRIRRPRSPTRGACSAAATRPIRNTPTSCARHQARVGAWRAGRAGARSSNRAGRR